VDLVLPLDEIGSTQQQLATTPTTGAPDHV